MTRSARSRSSGTSPGEEVNTLKRTGMPARLAQTSRITRTLPHDCNAGRRRKFPRLMHAVLSDWCTSAIRGQMQPKAPDVFESCRSGRAAEERGEVLDGADVVAPL